MRTIDLSEIIGVEPRTIDNIIYGRSRKRAQLQLMKIATALGINLSDYIDQSYSLNDKLKSEFNVVVYNRASNAVAEALENKKLHCSKKLFDAMASTLYEFILEVHEKSASPIENFTEGMVMFGKKNYLITVKPDEIPHSDEEIAEKPTLTPSDKASKN